MVPLPPCAAPASALLIALLAFPSAAQECVMLPNPNPIDAVQPDGARVRLRLRGSAHHHWHTDLAGYPVVLRGGAWLYARLDERGALVPTPHVLGRADPAAAGLRADVRPAETAEARRRGPRGRAELAKQRPQTLLRSRRLGPTPPAGSGGILAMQAAGTVENLVLILRFSDHGPGGQNRPTPSNADFGKVLNQVGGDPTLAPTGSVRDHYLEDSYGQLSIDSTVIGWLDLPQTEPWYANGTSGLDPHVHNLILDGLELADDLVDFSDFDQDGDGVVDAITFLHSGFGAEFGGTDEFGTGSSDRIWSHKWTIPTWTSDEGVSVADYNVSAGLWGLSGSDAAHIGVICHELGHFFGIPDLYDTDGSSSGIGNWCLMAGGSWGFGFDQRYPSHMSAWAKVKLGWVEPQVILPGAQFALQAETAPVVLRIDSGYPPGEYLLIENRQPVGFDTLMPQGGLAIWHVDDAKGSMDFNDMNADEGHPFQGGWPGNGSHYRNALLQADDFWALENGWDWGDDGDTYHAGGVNALDSASSPGTDAYQGGVTLQAGTAIAGISASGPLMTFTYANALAPSITTASLPHAVVDVAYAPQALGASGGASPIAWSEVIVDFAYVETGLGSSLFAPGGVPQGWNADDAIWPLALPFPFPYYDDTYATVHVGSNGFLDFVPIEGPDFANTGPFLRAALRIAPLWDDLDTSLSPGDDVYVDTATPGQVTVRWQATSVATGGPVNAAVTLFDDGRLRFDYGTGNSGLSPTVGISRGQAGDLHLVGGYDLAASLDSADSIELELVGSQVPPGMVLNAAGQLSGTPTQAGTWPLVVRARDAQRRYDRRTLSLEVQADCNGNGIGDAQEIAQGNGTDANANGVLDECEKLVAPPPRTSNGPLRGL